MAVETQSLPMAYRVGLACPRCLATTAQLPPDASMNSWVCRHTLRALELDVDEARLSSKISMSVRQWRPTPNSAMS